MQDAYYLAVVLKSRDKLFMMEGYQKSLSAEQKMTSISFVRNIIDKPTEIFITQLKGSKQD